MKDIMTFISHHWELSIAFLALLTVLLFTELQSKLRAVKSINPQQVTDLINHEHAVLIDIRDKDNFKSGHILNSKNAPKDRLMENVNGLKIKKSKPVIVVCTKGQSALKASSEISKDGFEKVYVLTGGITAWKEAKMPVEV